MKLTDLDGGGIPSYRLALGLFDYFKYILYRYFVSNPLYPLDTHKAKESNYLPIRIRKEYQKENN